MRLLALHEQRTIGLAVRKVLAARYPCEIELIVVDDGSSDATASIVSGLENKIFGRLPDATWVYPGHGGDTTLGAERPHWQEWRERGW